MYRENHFYLVIDLTRIICRHCVVQHCVVHAFTLFGAGACIHIKCFKLTQLHQMIASHKLSVRRLGTHVLFYVIRA